jgi:hypothetical protein
MSGTNTARDAGVYYGARHCASMNAQPTSKETDV